MEYSINLNGLLMPRRITVPLPDNMTIESGMVSTIKTSIYKSIIKQVDIYNRMNEDPGTASWAIKGMLSTPVFSDITMESPSDPKLKLTIDTVIIIISQTKNISRTTVNGRNGTVKEYFSMDDYDITITGNLGDENNSRYPTEKVSTLKKLLELPEALKLSGPFVELFEIFSGVVYNYKFDQKEGIQNTQFFEIKMYSDTPVELVAIRI